MRKIRHQYPQMTSEIQNSSWVLLGYVLNKPKSWLVAHTDYQIMPNQMALLETLFSRLMAGVPLAYLIGEWSFFGLDFYIDESVLIPRPETELLVEKAIAWLKSYPQPHKMVEVGTGSGCIAISIAASFPHLEIIATDISLQSLQVAQKNLKRHSIQNIRLVQGDLLGCLNTEFNLICANLPYIPSQRLQSLPVSTTEPWIALDGGENGLMQINKFLEQSTHLLAANGLLLMEIDSLKKREISQLAKKLFPGASITVCNDLAEKPRLLMVQSR